MLLMQAMELALDLALLKAGRSMPARMAMIAMTTRSSIRVNPHLFLKMVFINIVAFTYVIKENQIIVAEIVIFSYNRIGIGTNVPNFPPCILEQICSTTYG